MPRLALLMLEWKIPLPGYAAETGVQAHPMDARVQCSSKKHADQHPWQGDVGPPQMLHEGG